MKRYRAEKTQKADMRPKEQKSCQRGTLPTNDERKETVELSAGSTLASTTSHSLHSAFLPTLSSQTGMLYRIPGSP